MTQFFLKPTRVLNEYLKIQNLIFTSFQLEVKVLNHHRQFYNPNRFICQIKKAYKSKNYINLISAISLYSCNSFIFYFFPVWVISLPLYLFANLKIWRSTWLKTSFLLCEYKVWTKNSLIANYKGTLDFKIIISFFPFIFGISYIIYSRYQNQVFTYFIHKNLPGIYPSFPRLKWDTFQNITYHQLTIEPVSLTNLVSNKNILLPQEIANVTSMKNSASKLINVFTPRENKNEVLNLTSASDYQTTSVQAGSSQSSITPAFKLDKFIKQLDFYTDSFLIKLNSAWLNKKKQVYIGLFPKKNFLPASSIDTNFFFKSEN